MKFFVLLFLSVKASLTRKSLPVLYHEKHEILKGALISNKLVNLES